MAIETLEDWNTQLSYCGCCDMPSCPIPSIDCQTKTGSQTAYLWLPFVVPPGEPTDDIPFLYLNRVEKWNESWTTGAAWLYQGWNANPGLATEWAEWLQSQYYRGSITTAGLWENVSEGNSTTGDTGAHAFPVPFGPDVTAGGGGWEYFALIYNGSPVLPYDTTSSDFSTEMSPEKFEVTGTVYQHDGATINYVKGNGAPSLQGAGGADNLYTHSWDIEEHFSERYENTFQITKENIRNDAMIDSGEWPVDPDGAGPLDPPAPEGTGTTTLECASLFSYTWPKIGDISPWPDPAVDNPLYSPSYIWKRWASGSIRDVRYRWHIPEEWTGSYFKITWDVLTEPDGWDDTIDDPDYVPPDPLPDPPPPVPQIPKPGRPSRSYVQDLTAIWTGPGTPIPDPVLDEDENVTNQEDIDTATASWFTDWNDLNPPPVPGTRRVVNIRFECYHGPYGTKPQVTGEGVDLSEDTPLQKRFTTDRHAINYPLTY